MIHEHRDEDCPHLDQMKKLKSEIKRLRQELILKPNAKKKDDDDFENQFSEEEKQAIKMLTADQRKLLNELDQAGCNREFIKKKIRYMIMN